MQTSGRIAAQTLSSPLEGNQPSCTENTMMAMMPSQKPGMDMPSVAMPLAKPALVTVALLTFMFAWNDFLGPLIYLSDQAKNTLALGLALFTGQHQTDWGVLMAASILMMTPVVLLFFFFQRYFIKGFTMSGLKG